MELMCVRHGRTEWNANRRLQGHTDVPLDDEGRRQAKALGALLRDERIDLAVSSDLVRAQETTRLLLDGRDLVPMFDPHWRERQFGAWEGLTWEQILAANPQWEGLTWEEILVASPRIDPAGANSPRTYAPTGGESFDALCTRIARATERCIAELHDDAVVLIVTHAGPLYALLRLLLGYAASAARNVRFAHASVTRFRLTSGGWRLVRLNQTLELPRGE
jgi:2,3-bisphosphoglycerate-dependent phosphoglycerate mutase